MKLSSNSDNPKWERCIFCKRQWDEESLEFDLCPDCLNAIRGSNESYSHIRLEQFLKHGEFDDIDLAEAVRSIWEEVKKL